MKLAKCLMFLPLWFPCERSGKCVAKFEFNPWRRIKKMSMDQVLFDALKTPFLNWPAILSFYCVFDCRTKRHFRRLKIVVFPLETLGEAKISDLHYARISDFFSHLNLHFTLHYFPITFYRKKAMIDLPGRGGLNYVRKTSTAKSYTIASELT